MKKTIFICRIISACSAFVLLIFIVTSWGLGSSGISRIDGLGWYLYWSVMVILYVGSIIPLFVMIGLKAKMQSQNTDDKIKELEQEIERLKKK